MNILFISPVFSGGIGGHAAMLADKLSDYGYKVKKMQDLLTKNIREVLNFFY